MKSTIKLNILCNFQNNIIIMENVDFMPKNIEKPQKLHFLDSRFFESARHVLANTFGCDKYFSIILF